MLCKFRKILCLAAMLSVIGFPITKSLHAQNVTLESDTAPQLSNDRKTPDFLGVDESIPDELSLPEENQPQSEENVLMPIESGNALPDLNNPLPVSENALETNNAPLTETNAPLTGSNAPLTGPNAPLTGPNAAHYPSDAHALPETGTVLGSTQDSLAPDNLGEGFINKIDNELFSQMSDLEKQTALLTLELRREKIKSEIAAIQAQRQKAIDEEKTQKEEKERKRLEWEKEQEAKILREKKALEEVSLKMERLRQQKVLKAYKESMLDTQQKWIKNNARIYEQLQAADNERKSLIESLKSKMAHIQALSEKAQRDAVTAKENYHREIKNLQTQISIMKSRLETEIAEKKNDKTNPFAQPEVQVALKEETPRLTDEYVVMEIRGKGENLTAKLINKGGDSFLVRKGTILQTGHRVDEITQTYVRADINGAKDYLYFAAGGILDKEPEKSAQKKDTKAQKKEDSELRKTTMVNQGVPSLGSGMFVR